MDMKLKVAEYIAAAAKCCFENCGLGCEDLRDDRNPAG